MREQRDFDVIVVGSGVGGGATALRLASSGLSIALVERGTFLPREAENWNADEVFRRQRYQSPDERWSFDGGKPIKPASYYFVGGATKLFGGVMMRLRERDFQKIEYPDGLSPAWPIGYQDLEPYYGQAERLFGVHGHPGVDPTEPPLTSQLPFGPVDHDRPSEQFIYQLRDRGLRPFSLPLVLQRHSGGACVRCGTCDGYPCLVGAKLDAELALVRPAMAHRNVTLLDNSMVTRLELDPASNRISRIVGLRDGQEFSLRAKVFVVSAGAINSAALLLRSVGGRSPRGIANSSGVVGRHYMAHNSSVVMAVGLKKTGTVFQKSFGVNDFYFGDEHYPHPMGNVQMIGKLHGPMLAHRTPMLPPRLRQAIADRSVDWYLQSEDLPHPDSRVSVSADGSIRLDRKVTNLRSHKELVKRICGLMRSLGYPLVLSEMLGARTTSHQCGTVRMGSDPKQAALDAFCRTYDHPNLFVVDGSFFPSSAAVNPSLTIAAQALRVADHMLEEDFGIGQAGERPKVATERIDR
ncbi:GMC family oxidoreductase [Mesorhizobium sp. AR10]|uniref:GMC oxidoreductase n=1 Tax=Mesorhizobium sp. AR10 TaxID=2865839 RepID=UPI0021602628|nr:GMC family oxidoreductase [Mesorhizobium sp. AR10]UVK41172.1 GMC family oxidoreductase [Mesorhizobium sp. AR10]